MVATGCQVHQNTTIKMARHHKKINDQLDSWYGNDHAIGQFVDITSKTYAGSKQDEQGEGYIFEYSDMFKIGTNLANLTLEEVIKETPEFFKKIEAFHKTLK